MVLEVPLHFPTQNHKPIQNRVNPINHSSKNQTLPDAQQAKAIESVNLSYLIDCKYGPTSSGFNFGQHGAMVPLALVGPPVGAMTSLTLSGIVLLVFSGHRVTSVWSTKGV